MLLQNIYIVAHSLPAVIYAGKEMWKEIANNIQLLYKFFLMIQNYSHAI